MDLADHQQTPGNHIVPDCSANGQLPDESYIEKLFPKCTPPKQSQARTMNNFRNLNGSGGTPRQPHRRQNRSKFHQHHRIEPPVADTATPAMRKDNLMQKSDINPSDLNNNSSKGNDIDYDSSSSDSTDKDIRANGESGYSGVKRSASNQYGFDCKNKPNEAESSPSIGQQNNAPNRQRARRYKASKNLQPRIRRSQSIQNRLNPQSLPLDTSKQAENDPSSAVQEVLAETETTSVTTMPSTATAILTPVTSCPVPSSVALEPAVSALISSQSNGNESSMRNSLHSETSSYPNSSMKSRNSAAHEERRSDSKPINRTCRGIVFSEPLTTYSDVDNAHEQLATPSAYILAANQQGSMESSSTAQAPSSTPLTGSIAQMPSTLAAPRLEKVEETTADLDSNVSKIDTTKVASQSTATITENTFTSQNLHDLVGDNSRQLFTTIGATTINNNGTSRTLEVDDNLRDDDRYINLFVYDNTGPQRGTSESEELDRTKEKLDSPKQSQQDSNASNSVPYLPSHRLLTEDLSENEQDVVRNDTSTEELCSLADNDTENAKYKAAQRALENDVFSSISEESMISSETTTNAFVTNKAHSKYHRSIGTLQTVDEKAELIADIDAITTGVSDSSKIELIDISGSATMQNEDELKISKRMGLTPAPGFPRRVRSQLQPSNNNVEIPPQVLPTSTMAKEHFTPATGADQLPSTKQTDIRDSGPELLVNSQTKDHTVTETEICQLPEQLSLETDTNLSEALNKVSITKDSETNPLDPSQTMFPSQYHKLPNESSHYSIFRTLNKTQPSRMENVGVHRSRIQFNTLSDADSELDEQPNIEIRPNVPNKTMTVSTNDKKTDQMRETYTAGNSEATGKTDDDIATSNKTALIFPRLDEGLSSEAESCEDDIEEDDERAIEADVDADDEEGNDDDPDSPSRTTNRGASAMLINMDQYLRQQQQPQTPRAQNRIGGSQQQQSTTNISGMQVVPDTDVQQIKQTPNSPYANFISAQEPLDQNDLKSHPNYSNHNGQSNYWMGPTSQTTMSTQSPAGQSQPQFPIQRNQHHGNSNNGNDINMPRPNNYSNRDEAKSVNRLSSDTDNETDRLLGTQRNDQLQKITNNELVSNNNPTLDSQTANNFVGKQTSNSREVMIDGVLFNVKYLGSTHTECEGRGEKEDRIHQAEMAVHEVKFRNGDSQPPVEVQLFISTEKIMVLDDKHRKIMMDHSLRTISYIADIGDAIVLIVRKKSTSMDTTNELGRPISKTSCHVFESNESHTITKSISQAFQVAYTELLKANGAGDTGSYLPKELDYQEVLNSQEMSTTELEMFARKDNQREVIVPKQEGEILGLSIVESGWGSVLPTAVIASLKQDGPAYRCKKLSVGDQILSINGISLVGLSLAECQKILRKTKSQSVARLSIVPCPITVEVKIKRPHTKYQLGFSVQHGVICSLLRGGIAERGGVRVGHRIISINGTTVVGVPHDKIVTLLASSVGEIRMKTCLTSLYRHILGEEKNVSFV